jgi:MOSC domain-containing protein YiiM
MTPTDTLTLSPQAGIEGEPRYSARTSRRQLTLIACEQLAAHADALGLPALHPGEARSNIETTGITLVPLLGRRVRIGTATVLFYEARTPCAKMDAVAPGLRAQMEESRQGVLARVLTAGVVRVGDSLEVIEEEEEQAASSA